MVHLCNLHTQFKEPHTSHFSVHMIFGCYFAFKVLLCTHRKNVSIFFAGMMRLEFQ